MLGLDHDAVLAPTAGTPDVPALPTGQLRAEPVPTAQKPQTQPVIKILLPIVMVVAVGAVMALMMTSGRTVSPMMLIFPLMMLFGLLGMINPQDRQGDINETRRVYLRHLDALTRKARANAAQQRAHATGLHPAPADLVAATPVERVWERTAASPLALTVRLGTGSGALCTPVDVEDPGSPEDLDPVCAVSLRRTVAAVSTVPGMPIVVQLDAFPAVTLAGPGAHEVARSIVCQLAFFHGPELVSIDAPFAWAKWLPHARAEHARFRVVLIDATVEHLHAPDADCVIVVHPDEHYFVDPDAFHLVCTDTLAAVTEQGMEQLGLPDSFTDAQAEFIARHLGFYRRPEGASEDTGDLLAMLGITDLDALDATTMWPGMRNKLVVPIGATPDGQPVYLDFKESALGGMGPHGLCIGATGSGKSELLKEIVVALAATHSPDELNLVLVDFKGGATFLGCEDLPHTSAVITNLEDEAVLVERMFDAISGELNRRQELLRAAGNFANITDYTRAGHTLPSLVIIVDEFSELLSQHPHFADLFVAVGRLGRSLGVHLLLASQRLEEGKLRGLDSHLSYRIGLKTFSAGESRQVLGVPDAYELPSEPGSGYLKSGMELTRFRGSYVSGPLTRQVLSHSDDTPTVRVFTGDEIEIAPQTVTDTDYSTTLFDAVVEKARDVAATRSMRAHQVWLPPLPDTLALSSLVDDTIALVDEPYRQLQVPFAVDFSRAGGHAAIAGAPQTGKSMAVRSIVAKQALCRTTDEVAIYIINAGGGDYSDIESLPHVAGVANAKDEERTRRVIDEVTGLLDAPASRATLLVVDGWHALLANDSKLEDLRDPLARIASEGPAARVHLLITTQRWNAVRANVRDLIGTRIEMRLTEPMDSLIDRKAQERLAAVPGRALTPDGKVMHVALTSAEDIAHIATQAASQTPVPRLRVLPARVDAQPLIDGTRIPLGIGGADLAPLYSTGHILAIGAGGAGKSAFIASTIAAISAMPREQARMVICDPRRAHLAHADSDMVAAYAASSSALTDAVRSLATTLTSRLPGSDVTPAQLADRSWWAGPELYLLIDDLDLVGDEPLRPIIDLLPHARDIGLHIVVARKFGGVGRAMFGPFLAAVKDLHPDVLILDGTKDEGALFGVRPAPQPPGRATLVQGEPKGMIQLPMLNMGD